MSIGYIISFFCISIGMGLLLGIYIRLYREKIANKYMFYGARRFLYYQIVIPFILFPKIILNNKKIFAEFLTNEVLGIDDKEKKTHTIDFIIENWDRKLTWILWCAYFNSINHDYDEFTNQNLELVKRDIRYLRNQSETSKKTTVRKQIVLLENSRTKNQLLDKLAAASVFV